MNIGGATAATLDLSQAGNGDKADQITVQVTANDGTASSTALDLRRRHDRQLGADVSSVAIDQAAPKTNDTLTVSVTSADADGDAVTYAYQWKKERRRTSAAPPPPRSTCPRPATATRPTRSPSR